MVLADTKYKIVDSDAESDSDSDDDSDSDNDSDPPESSADSSSSSTGSSTGSSDTSVSNTNTSTDTDTPVSNTDDGSGESKTSDTVIYNSNPQDNDPNTAFEIGMIFDIKKASKDEQGIPIKIPLNNSKVNVKFKMNQDGKVTANVAEDQGSAPDAADTLTNALES